MFWKQSKLILLTIYLVLSFAGCKKTGNEVLNIFEAKESVKQYHKSGKYLEQVTYQANQAKKYITSRLKKAKCSEKPAIVLSLDDTILNEYDHNLETDFSQVQAPLNEWKKKAQIPPLKPIVNLYNFAKKNNLTIFIITIRKVDLKDSTVKNLNLIGLKDWKEIYFAPSDNYSNAQDYKTQIRKKITDDGFTIIANIGDQDSDLMGGFSEKTYKLPNHINYVK